MSDFTFNSFDTQLNPKVNIYYRIVEMENGDFVLQRKHELLIIPGRDPDWCEIGRGTLEEMQTKRLHLDATYRPEYKTIKRIVD